MRSPRGKGSNAGRLPSGAERHRAREGKPLVFEYDAAPGAGCALFDGDKEYAPSESSRPMKTPSRSLPRSPRCRLAASAVSESRKCPGRPPANGKLRVKLTMSFIVYGGISNLRPLLWKIARSIPRFGFGRLQEISLRSRKPRGNLQTPAKPPRQDVQRRSLRRRRRVAGPVYSTLQVKSESILTLFTTPDPGAWVNAQAILYRGIKRVDFRSELNTYPQMAFSGLRRIGNRDACSRALPGLSLRRGAKSQAGLHLAKLRPN